MSQFKTLNSETHSSIFEGFTLHEYVNVGKLVCNNKHNQPCVVCSRMINVAQTVLDKGFLKLKTAFKMVSPDVTYTALHARRKLLQIPLVTLGIGDRGKGNYSIYFVEKQCSVQYKFLQSLLNNWINCQDRKSPEVYLRKETVKEPLKLAESSGERQRLKYAIVKAAGMSSTQAKETYGFNNMSTKIGEVESALEDAAAIRNAIENIADIKDQAVLHSLGIYDTTVEDESESSDDSETDSDISEDEAEIMRLEQVGKQESAEGIETNSLDDQQLMSVLRSCDLNWIEFVRVVNGMQESKKPNLTENMLAEFARKLSSLNLNNQEKGLIDQSRKAYLFQKCRKDKEADVDDGLVVSESDGDDPTELLQVQDPLDAKGKAIILKKRAAIRRKAKRDIAKRIAERRFFAEKTKQKIR